MTSQAITLEMLSRRLAETTGAHAPPFIGITGGKGGIGKSTIAANLAIALARGVGRGVAPKVLLVDCDFGLSSLDAIFNFPRHRNLSHAMEGRAQVDQLIVKAPGGAEVLLAPRGIERFATLSSEDRASVISQIRRCSQTRDITILDLPAGIHADGLALAHCADLLIIVVTPDPASLADAYAVLKIAKNNAPGARFGLLVNEAEGPVEARQLAQRFSAVVERFLGTSVESLGWIPRDAAVARATIARKPIVVSEPGAPAAAAIRVLAGRVTSLLEKMSNERADDLSAWS